MSNENSNTSTTHTNTSTTKEYDNMSNNNELRESSEVYQDIYEVNQALFQGEFDDESTTFADLVGLLEELETELHEAEHRRYMDCCGFTDEDFEDDDEYVTA